MPYVSCPRCGLTTYTASCWSTVEACARCGTELPRLRRHAGESFGHRALDLERAVGERLYPGRADEAIT